MSKPTKLLAQDAGFEGARRFRFAGLHERLAQTDAQHAKLAPVPVADESVDATTSHIGTALAELAERNLTAHFTSYAAAVRSRTLSLPLVLRGRAVIVRRTCDALRQAAKEQPDAVEPIALCAAALARDLGPQYFMPHFKDLVQAFASALDADTMWNPELVLLPVFAALAPITKVLAAHLVAKPDIALKSVLPLLAHSHYRVRELTAESCVGYILRKTRQDAPRDNLVAELVGVVEKSEVPVTTNAKLEHVPAAHGAGAALFEALVAPDGGLRPRAVPILQTALRKSTEVQDESIVRSRFVVVAHAVARLCIHAKSNYESAKQILLTVFDIAKEGISERNAAKIARVLFLVRHSVRVFSSNPTSNSSTELLLHKAVTVALNALTEFPTNEHVVYESFACFFTVSCNATHRRVTGWVNSMIKFLSASFDKLTLTSVRNIMDLLIADKVQMAVESKKSPLMSLIKWFSESLSSENQNASALAYPAFTVVNRLWDGVDARLEDLVKKPAGDLVGYVVDGTASEEVLSAINVQLAGDNKDSYTVAFEEVDSYILLSTLGKNLSSTSSTVRKQSALLLYRFSCSRCTHVDFIYVSPDFDPEEAMRIRKRLGDALEEDEYYPDWLVFAAILVVCITPYQLDYTPVVKEIFGRIGRHAGKLSTQAMIALSNFCIGMFCARFKPFWDGARELWGALADADSAAARKPMENALNDTSAEILKYYSDQREGEYNGDENAAEEAEIATKVSNSNSGKSKPKKRPRSSRGTQIEQDSSKDDGGQVRKSRKMQSIFVLLWSIDEWKTKDTQAKKTQLAPKQGAVYDGTLESSCVDVLTRHLEYLNVLSQFPKSTLKMRAFIVDDLYLKLDPSLLSRKSADRVVQQYGILLEKMGGLKVSENDKEREARLKTRLYRDLTRPCSAAQSEILRCICVSRSPELKPYKDTLLRLVGDRTFREEVTLLTETLSADAREVPDDGDIKKAQIELTNPMVDVLVRICFSKMRGNRQKFNSRRTSAVSFACSSLPSEQSVPMLIALILESFQQVIGEACSNKEDTDAEVCLDMSKVSSEIPDEKLCVGVLTSLDSLLRHGWGAIPDEQWRYIVTALVLVVAQSKFSFQGQMLRSDALGLLAGMMERKPALASFGCIPALELVSDIGITSSGGESITSAPALLKLLSSCFKSQNYKLLSDLVQSHMPACEWAVSIFAAQSSSVNAVELVTDVALGIVEMRKKAQDTMDDKADSNEKEQLDNLVNKLANAIRTRLRNLRDNEDQDWYRTKSNRDMLQLLMKVLSNIVTCADMDREILKSLVESLLFIITETKLYGAALLSSIQALETVVLQLESQDCAETVEEEVAPVLAPILSSSAHVKQIDVKVAVCRIMRKFKCVALQMVSLLVMDSFATNSRRLDEADLDVRSQAFTTLISILKRAENCNYSQESMPAVEVTNGDLESSKSSADDPDFSGKSEISGQWGENSFLLVIHACLCAVEDEDVSVRGTASHTLYLLVKIFSKHRADVNSKIEFKLCDLLTNKSVSTSSIAPRREFCKLLGNLVRGAKVDNNGNEDGSGDLFRSLCLISHSEDLEADFFENVAHLQVHRRSRALRRLAKKLNEIHADKDSASSMSEAICQFLFPLSVRIALEMSMGNETLSRSSRRSKASKQGYNRDVVNTAIALNHACVKFLPWQVYRKEVSTIVRKIPRETEEERAKVLYALLVGFADAFPGSNWNETDVDTREKVQKSFLSTFLIPKLISFISCASFEGEVHITANYSKKEKSGSEDRSMTAKVFRAPVGIAVAKLVALLDEDSLNAVIPTMVTPLSNALRSRMHEIRNEAKRVLVEVVTQLDPKYFAYIVDQVLSALSSGFRKETIIYVIQAILTGVRESRNNGDENRAFPVDGAVKKLCKAMVDELEDGLHASKTDYLNPNASTSRIKESAHRASKVAEVSQLLGELIDFSTSARLVLKPFTNVLTAATSSRLIARVSDVLNKAIVGFSKNSSLNELDGLKLAYELVNTNMPTPNMIAADDSEDSIHLRNKLQPLLDGRNFTNSPGSHVLCELGWLLLSYLFSKGVIDAEGKQQQHREAQSKIAPFLPELLLSMRSRYDSLTRLSLKSAQRIMRLPMSGRRELADVMAATTVEVLTRNLGISANRTGASSAIGNDDGLFNTCLRASAVLVQEIGYHDQSGIRRERVVALLQIARNVLGQGSVEARSAALALIKSAVMARITIPEVYDIAEFVCKLAIHSQSAALQSSCSGIIVQFLIYFPLRNKRMRQHLEFLVRNLSYEYPHGRIAAINILVALCQQFPEKNLNYEAEYFFLSLAAVVGQDDNQECRKAAAGALQSIFTALEDRRINDSLMKMALTFVTGSNSEINEDLDLLRTGSVAISAAAESGKMTPEQLKNCILKLTTAAVKSMEADWESQYSLLCSLEKLFDAQGESQLKERLELQPEMKQLWMSLPELLLHQHEWVRTASSRLLGCHLAATGGREASIESPLGAELYSVLWVRDGTLRNIAKSLTLEFEAEPLSQELAKQSLKNLLCITNIIVKCPHAGDVAQVDQVDDEARTGNRPLTWVIARVSGLSTRVGEGESVQLRRACGLRFLLQAVKWWGNEVLDGRLKSFVAPIVQILESKATTPQTNGRDTQKAENDDASEEEQDDLDALSTLALTLQEALSEAVGAAKYYEMYRDLASKRRGLKIERKRKAAIEAVVDPERAAKKRQRKTEKKAANRKANRSMDRSDRVLYASHRVFEEGEQINIRE